MKSYVIHFVRHGITQANIDGGYVGITDIPVCENGLEELKNLKKNYEYPKVECVFSSPLLRCKQTSKLIFPGCDIEIVEGLREINFGDFENKTSDILKDCEDFKAWVASGFMNTPPNGENIKEFNEKLFEHFRKLVTEILSKGIENSAIVTHGGVIMGILSKFSIEEKKYFDWMVDNGCGYSVRITPSIWMRSEKFEVFGMLPRGIKSVCPEVYRKKMGFEA